MTPRVVVADDPSMPLVVAVYADGTRIDVPVSPLRALALAGQLIEAAGGRLRAAQSVADKSDTKTTEPLFTRARVPVIKTVAPAHGRAMC